MTDIRDKIRHSAWTLPSLEGPVPVTEDSHPFCAMAYSRTPLLIENYGYVEEEFFLSGFANVYDTDAQNELFIKKEKLPYKNRILVRRPIDREAFSGRVYMDILNATQGYDIEDLWHRNYLWCMEHGHAYVGVTSKPVNVLSLKNFDYDRYQSLNWSNGERIPYPSVSRSATIPGTEEGLVWDILNQTAALLRDGGARNGLGGYDVKWIYLCGQSQSGAYLNTYVSYFDEILSEGRRHLYDGYMNLVGALVQRSVCQDGEVGPLKLKLRNMKPSVSPYICLSSEADLTLFRMFVPDGNLLDIRIENKDDDRDKCRYYEIAGTPHTDIVCPVLSAVKEVEKTGSVLPNLDQRLLEYINDIPTEFYICGLLEKLHIWASTGTAPLACTILERENGELKKDAFGNVLGGLRTPFTEVPLAVYTACNPDDPEGICGKMSYFSREQALAIYGSKENYLERFREMTVDQVREQWISETDGRKMIDWSVQAAERVFGA